MFYVLNNFITVDIADERRPTVNELSNQKGVLVKASGWKIYHLASQLEELVRTVVLYYLFSTLATNY